MSYSISEPSILHSPSILLWSSITETISAIVSSRSLSSSSSFVLLRSFPPITEPEPEFPLPEQLPVSSSKAEAPRFRLAGAPIPPPLTIYIYIVNLRRKWNL